MLKHKGYAGHVIYDDEARIFHGEVIGLKAVITFQGTNVDEIETAFKESIDDYLDWCKERGVNSEKSYSGRLVIRMPPELHFKMAIESSQKGLSMNTYIINKLKEE